MAMLTKIKVAAGVYWVEAPEADLRVLCACPADSVKHLMKRGLILTREELGVAFETGPNAILLSDVLVQKGGLANLAEFPVLQMLYRQGMLLPDHPRNTGERPLLMGAEEQVKAQMEYIYRGNYGLISEAELVAAGVPSDAAREMMRIKLRFAFGQIRPTEELLDSVIVGGEPAEIRNGVSIRRLRLNVFEFRYRKEAVVVDLNLDPHERYEVPFPLGYHQIDREYFAVIHSGDGDGWDVNRPAMASILMFQGRLYLIDAGANILHSLRALGIGVSEIEGIFHTHAHDDHFCGLTTLMRSDHRIKYYATPMVRTSVMKKLSALVSMDEAEFSNFFEMHDLKQEEWNYIDGLDVRPAFSPHPVETTIFTFRARCAEGYRSYAHWADTVGLETLKGMVNGGAGGTGILARLYERIRADYLAEVDVKKIDIGGGLIHGRAEDFRYDPSRKIILSHTALELTDEQKEIGSGAPFGAVDVLIPAHQDYVRAAAFRYLASYFPAVPAHELELLLNSPVVTFNPETILLKAGDRNSSLYLILTGSVERIQSELKLNTVLSAGAFVGESPGLTGAASERTYRAASFVQALEIPRSLYWDFVKANGLDADIGNLREKREFLQRTWLFGDDIAYPVHNSLAKAVVSRDLAAGEAGCPGEARAELWLVRKGRLLMRWDRETVEELLPGDFCGECGVFPTARKGCQVQAAEATQMYCIPADVVLDIPVVRWKLFEVHERRMRTVLSATVK
ncbi:MAG: cyclic nucleotide-binding protein [Lentisphaerae bacterium RIFOXYB12_FULL_65_16]|nr:MAG: cyclic nucleotide-binding protein [Lentisphaerae bacterium RIFOXYA12_64_32]OGV90224.1 MAG: cyclic nucleotide-binding protein [Lentisphaerae bacterium RIFOXYB12_FULL_65_16]